MQTYPYPRNLMQTLNDDQPNALALLNGNKDYPTITGIVKFYQTPYKGIIIQAEFLRLPLYTPADIPSFYGFHIHENADCSDNFAKTGDHYNPKEQPHPFHAGDLPPLTSCDGYAWMNFYAQQLTLDDVIGKSVVVHAQADDFTSQPSGNSGSKIACGIIEKWEP